MKYELEFFKITTDEPSGKATRRQFVEVGSLKEAQGVGLGAWTSEEDGFRIYQDGKSLKTILGSGGSANA